MTRLYAGLTLITVGLIGGLLYPSPDLGPFLTWCAGLFLVLSGRRT